MNITQPRGKTNIGPPSSAPLSRSRWRLASASSTITASTVSRGGLQRRQAQPQQRADATGAGNAADAEETVKPDIIALPLARSTITA